MPAVHRLHRVVDLREPTALRVEIHDPDCECAACAPYLQPAEEPREHLTLSEIGWLTWGGLLIGNAVAFAIDPHGCWHALTAIVTGAR